MVKDIIKYDKYETQITATNGLRESVKDLEVGKMEH